MSRVRAWAISSLRAHEMHARLYNHTEPQACLLCLAADFPVHHARPLPKTRVSAVYAFCLKDALTFSSRRRLFDTSDNVSTEVRATTAAPRVSSTSPLARLLLDTSVLQEIAQGN